MREVCVAAISLIKTFEGFANPVAGDGFGNATGGWGHTGGGIYIGEPVSDAQGEEWLVADLAKAGAGVTADLPGVPLNDNQYGALVALCFNSGTGDIVGTNLHKLLMAQDWMAAAADILNFDHVGSQVVAGLLRRCDAEMLLFETPVTAASSSSGWVVFSDSDKIAAQIFDGSAYAPVRALFESVFGAETDTALAWQPSMNSVSWSGESTDIHCQLIDGAAWGSVRDFAPYIGWTVTVDGQTITLAKSP